VRFAGRQQWRRDAMSTMPSTQSSPPELDRSVGALLRRQAQATPDRTFVIAGEGRRFSYADVDERTERLARGLIGLGVQPGEHIALLLGNGPEFIVTWLALAKIGAVEVPINTAFRGASLEYILNHSDAKVLVADSELADRVVRIADRLTRLERVIVVGEAEVDLPWEQIGFERLADLGADGASVADPGAEALLAVLYTSGTTGHPKGVLESHRCAAHWGTNYAKYMRVGADDTNYLFPPLFHAMSQFLGVMPALLTGSAVALSSGFSASRFWDDCRRDGVTLFNFTGGVLSFLWKQPERFDDIDNPVTRALGVPIPDHLYTGFERRFGIELLPPFGTSESGVVCYSRPGQVRAGSSGQPIPEYEVAIVDDDDHPVAPGVRGEIVTRPRHADSMMRGYYKAPDVTVHAFRNLWYHTGDLGYLDADGYLFFVDRKKDAIRRRGENISSFEIERVIDRHPAVLESAAVGVPSAEGEEEVKLAVVLRENAQLTAAALWEYCDEELPRFMVPRYVEFRPALPKTQTERVQKHLIRDDGIHPGVSDRLAKEST
jgi:crotonobetaine/carnitine-CoA ligase